MNLVLNTFGTALNRDNEGFVVTQQQIRQRIPADDLKSIHISNGANITSDAVLLAIEKEIEIIFVDKQGHPQGRIWSSKYGSISTIRKGQLQFVQSEHAVQMYIMMGKNETAVEVLRPFAQKQESSFWIWAMLADMHTEIKDKMMFYCKAILCKSKDEMLVKIRQHAGIFMFHNGHPALGKNLIEQARQTRIKNNWKIPNDICQLTQDSLYKQTTIEAENKFVHQQAFLAEQFIYGKMKEITVMITKIDNNRHLIYALTEKLEEKRFRIPQNNRKYYMEGTLARITITEDSRYNNKIIVHRFNIIPGFDNHFFYKTIHGCLKIYDTGFGVVKDVYVPQNLLTGYQSFSDVSVTAIRSFNKKKQTFGWKAIKIGQEKSC